MSAQIPETMLLSDLLKSTGYDCPEELQGKTFAEATVGDSETQTKEVTIVTNTSTEVKPDSGKLLKKVTVITAVPNKLFAFGTAEGVVYTLSVPEEDMASIDVYVPAVTGLTKTTGAYTKEGSKITVSTTDYARYDTGDVQL